jgi:hypothetical protein
MPIDCPRRGCPGKVPDDATECPICHLTIRPEDRALARSTPPPPGSLAWWLGGDGFRFLFQILVLLFLVTALVLIISLVSRSSNDTVKLSEFTTTQGLIAGVLLTAVAVGVIVAIMNVLFSSGAETLRDRIQLVRDILAPILAIFGTITGFYFGAKTVEERGKPTTEASAKKENPKENPAGKQP